MAINFLNNAAFAGTITVQGTGDSSFVGNVGIGTDSPTAPLHIEGGTNSEVLKIEANSDPYIRWVENGTDVGFLQFKGDDAFLSNMSDGDFFFRTNNTNKMTIRSNGNVGIGTTSPLGKLMAREDSDGNPTRLIVSNGGTVQSGTSARLSFYEGTSEKGYIERRRDGSGKLAFYTPANDNPFVWENPSGEIMRINNGNVGIGTTNPGEPLTVKTKTEAYFPGIKVEDYNSSMGLYVQNLEGQNSGIGTGRYYNSGFWRSDVTAPTTIRLDGGVIRFYAQSGVTADANYTPTEKMRITSTGNVGIGTDNPVPALHVYQNNTKGGTAAGLTIEQEGTGDAVLSFLLTGTERWKMGIDNSDSDKFKISKATNLSSNNALTIDANLNVGIGTDSPDTKLHVEGNVLIDAYDQGEDSGLFFREGFLTIDQPSITVWDMTNAGASPDGLSINSNDGIRFRENLGEVARFKNGNFGIGTTSPISVLEISQQLSAASTIDYPYTISSRDDGGLINQLGGEGVGIKFRIAGNDATTPGNSLVGASIAAIKEGSSDTNSSAGLGFFVSQDDETLDEAVRIDHDGNVGINDTTPSYKLDVNGEGRFIGDLRCLSLIQTSQSDKKEFIQDIVKTTNKKIEFKEYVYKSDSGNRKRYGVLAEDIEVDYPELVHIDADGVKGVNYIDLLVKRVAELERELEDVYLTAADDLAAPSASKVGTFRYRTSGNNSYVDMCMQTGATTYAWVNIVQNNW